VYDRGNPSQIVHPHQLVDPHTYTADKVKLPLPDDIPGVELQVQNYHEPPVGTFHAKYMVVDRKIAILNSNNIQDRVSSFAVCRRDMNTLT
jgi:phosphatidylserine/phosphatidylglycerophosphate/cardiolipin synthase-like enzyme